MRIDEVAFLDSNILIYTIDERSPFNSKAKSFMERVNAGEVRVCISLQIIGEIYATITNPRKANIPLPPEKAVEIVSDFWYAENIMRIYPREKSLGLTLDLVKRYQIKAMDFFDAQIVATMLENGVRTIYTVNEGDFRKFKEIDAVNPLK